MTPVVALIVAVSQNGVIGRDGAMPWHLSTDLKRFKALTLGHPVIMGRKTFQSVGKPLPGRLNIIVTRDRDWQADGALAVGSLGAALDLAAVHLESFEPPPGDPGAEAPNTIFVAGGGEIYAQAMSLADMLHVTRVEAEIEGDTVFPKIDEAVWTVAHEEPVPAGTRDSHATRYMVWERG